MQSNGIQIDNTPNIIVITDSDQNQITVTQPIVRVIEVNNPGPQGQPGATGPQGPSGSLQPNSTGSFGITGSLLITGSNPLTVIGPTTFSGSLNVTQGITGSLFGTASYSTNALSASYALTASYASNVPVTASYALTASVAVSSSYAVTASYLIGQSPTSSYALTASYVNPLVQNVIITGSLTVSGSSTFTNIGPAIFSGSITQNASTASFGGVVGIGISAPSSSMSLDISGSTRITGGGLRLTDTTSTIYLGQYGAVKSLDYPNVYFGFDANGTIVNSQNTIYLKTGNTNNGVTIWVNSGTVFGTGNDNAPNYKVLITGSSTSGSLNVNNVLYVSGSNVGIGTSTPTYPLSINSSTNGLLISSINNSAYNAIAVNNDFVINGAGVVQLGRLTATTTFNASTHQFNIGSSNNRITTTNAGGFEQAFTFAGSFGSSRTLSIGSGLSKQGLWYDTGSAFGIYRNTFADTTSPVLLAATTGDISIPGNLTVTGSIITNSALTASSALINGNVIIRGTASVDVLVTNYQSSSIIYASGSTLFGDTLDDNHWFTGSLYVTASTVSLQGGSFSGSGANLFNIPASGITGLNLSQIATGSVSASVSPGTGSFIVSSGSSNFLFVSSSGNVGIGTTTPAYKLEVSDTIKSNNVGGVAFLLNGSSAVRATGRFYLDSAEQLTIRAGLGTGTNPYVAISQKLYVGSDTNGVPSATTHIVGSGATSSTTSLLVQNSAGNTNAQIYDDGQWFIGTGNIRLSGTPGNFHFNTAAGNVANIGHWVINFQPLGYAGISLTLDNSIRLSGPTFVTGSLTVTGSLAVLGSTILRGNTSSTGSLSITGSAGTGSALTVYKSGSTVVDVQGSSGQLFSITDSLTGSLFSVNTVAGLPVIEAFSDNTVNIGKYGIYPIKVAATGTLAIITGSFSGSLTGTALTASYVNPLTQSVLISGSIASTDYIQPQYIASSASVVVMKNIGGAQYVTDLSTGGAGDLRFYYGGGGGWSYNWYTDNIHRVRISDGGMGIGIGSTNPSARLHVKGSGTTSSTTALLVQNSAGTQILNVTDDGILTVGTNSNNSGALLFQWPRAGVNGIFYGDSSSSIYGSITLDRGSGEMRTFTGTTYFPTFYSSGAEAMRIATTRNVLIGTTTDSGFKLDVSGSGRFTNGLTNTGSFAQSGSATFYGGNYIFKAVSSGDGGIQIDNSINGYTSFNWLSNTVGLGLMAGGGLFAKISNTNVGFHIGNSPSSTFVATLAVTGLTTTTGPTFVARNSAGTNILKVVDSGLVGINNAAPSASLHVVGNTILSGSAGTGSALTVYKSGSTVVSIQGSQGELFSITDSLSGSLFSVSNVSGLPILEVFSDNTVLLGNYLDPMLVTTQRLTANSGSTIIYSLPTASYDGVFMDYVIRSGSSARAGQFMGLWSGSSTNIVDSSTTDFGDTSGFVFALIVSGSNMVLTGSASTSTWTVRAGIRSI